MRTRGIESALKFAVAVALSDTSPDQTLFVLSCVETVPAAVLFTVSVNGPVASAPAVSRTPDIAAASTRTDTARTTFMARPKRDIDGLTCFSGDGECPSGATGVAIGRHGVAAIPQLGEVRSIPPTIVNASPIRLYRHSSRVTAYGTGSGPSRARTGDLVAASHALSQLSYGPSDSASV